MLRWIVILGVLALVFVLVKQVLGSGVIKLGIGRRRFKCATCRNCSKLFDDGVLCRYMDNETFKNETHIKNCADYAGR